MPKLKAPAQEKPKADYSTRAWYSVDEWITDIAPQSRAAFYQDVRAGRIKTIRRGRRRLVPASERVDQPARLIAAE